MAHKFEILTKKMNPERVKRAKAKAKEERRKALEAESAAEENPKPNDKEITSK